MVGADVFIEDPNSTNGTYINGKAIKKQLLSHNDTVEIGKYKIKHLVEDGTDYEKTQDHEAGPATGAASAAAYRPRSGLRRLRVRLAGLRANTRPRSRCSTARPPAAR